MITAQEARKKAEETENFRKLILVKIEVKINEAAHEGLRGINFLVIETSENFRNILKWDLEKNGFKIMINPSYPNTFNFKITW